MRIKRQTSSHVFICPRLCVPLWWIKQLYKAADIVFEISPGKPGWPTSMHQPLLLIRLLIPFLREKPWQLRGTLKMYAVGGQLQGLFEKGEHGPTQFSERILVTMSPAWERVGSGGVEGGIFWRPFLVFTSLTRNRWERGTMTGCHWADHPESRILQISGGGEMGTTY